MTNRKKPKLSSPHLQVAQKAFIVVDRRLLMVRHGAADRLNPHRWEVPGGRMIANESLDESICREVQEEVSISIEPGPTFASWSWEIPAAGDNDHLVQVIGIARLCRSQGANPKLPDSAEWDHLDALKWVPLDEIFRMDLIPNAEVTFRHFLRVADASIHADWIC